MTDEEIQTMAEQLGPFIQRVALEEGFHTPEDIERYLERLLAQGGLQYVNGVWREVLQ